MTNDEFAALVAKLEGKAARDSAGYQSRALLLALLGNAYLGGVVVLVAGLIIGLLAMVTVLKMLAIKFAFVLGGFLLLVLRAIWIRLPPPQGIEVTRQEAPELFDLIDGLRASLRAPRFHKVLVTSDFNAAVCQVPRLGIFAGTKNYLLIGLPLMKSLRVEQLRAVLAHEFGHLARGHGRIANWIYCQRLRWSRLATALQESESSGSFIFQPLFNRFVPYFVAYSFPLARANEYQADAAAARLTSSRAMSEALTGLEVVANYLDQRFWPSVHRGVDDNPEPQFMPYSGLGPQVARELDANEAAHWIQESLARQTNLADTHPSLADRLRAIGEAPHLSPPGLGEAADQLLGNALVRVTRQLDEEWHSAILPSWEARHKSVQEERRQLAELDRRSSAGEAMSIDDRFQHARLLDGVGGQPEQALARLRDLVLEAPAHVGASYLLGIRLLQQGDDAGIALLERVMEQDPASVPHLASVLGDYSTRRDRPDDAKRWYERASSAADTLAAVEREESTIRLTDTFVRHDLESDALEWLRGVLARTAHLKRAYLVRKKMPVAGPAGQHVYVLAISVRGWRQATRESHTAEATEQLLQSGALPSGAIIIGVNGENYRFGRKFFWMRGARIS
jgi:Zn-dependent protease with chaperone function